jgi:hypothetical protein
LDVPVVGGATGSSTSNRNRTHTTPCRRWPSPEQQQSNNPKKKEAAQRVSKQGSVAGFWVLAYRCSRVSGSSFPVPSAAIGRPSRWAGQGRQTRPVRRWVSGNLWGWPAMVWWFSRASLSEDQGLGGLRRCWRISGRVRMNCSTVSVSRRENTGGDVLLWHQADNHERAGLR